MMAQVQLAAQSQSHLTTLSLRPTDSPVVDHAVDGEPPAEADGGTDGGGSDDSPLSAMATALRTAHGRSYDELIDVSALLRLPAATASESARDASNAGVGNLVAEAHRDAGISAVMIGDELLRFPRLHALLRKRGVPLVETSAALPHLILDHESGVIVLDLPTLRESGVR